MGTITFPLYCISVILTILFIFRYLRRYDQAAVYFLLFQTLPDVGLLLLQIIHSSRLRHLWAPRALLIVIKEDFAFLIALKAGKSVASNDRVNPHVDSTALRERKVVRINCSVMPLKSCTRRCMSSARLFLYSIST